MASVISMTPREMGWGGVGRHKARETASCLFSLHVSIDALMSGRDNIMGPQAMQLLASVFSLLSHKSTTNFVTVLTDENFFPRPSVLRLCFFQ